MADRGIIFSASMIAALLAGRKSMTRRLLRGMNNWVNQDCREVRLHDGEWCHFLKGAEMPLERLRLKFGAGDRLYVREQYSGPHAYTGTPPRDWHFNSDIWYWADGNPEDGDWTKPKPGMHMPRWASRLTLTVTGVKVERLQEISEEDARAEGIIRQNVIVDTNCYGGSHVEITADRHFFDGGPDEGFEYAQDAFAALWNSLHGPGAWAANPWCVAVAFSVALRNIDAEEAVAA